MRRQLSTHAQTLDWYARRLQSPAAAITHKRLQLQSWSQRLAYSARYPLQNSRASLTQLQARLRNQLPDTESHQIQLAEWKRRLAAGTASQTRTHRQALAALEAQLELLSPQRTLERGYSILSDHKGKLIRSTKQLQPNTSINIRTAGDSAEVGIASVQPSLD